MNRTVVMLTVAAVGIVLGLVGSHVLNAQQEPVKRTVLVKSDLAGGQRGRLVPRGAGPRGRSVGNTITLGPSCSMSSKARLPTSRKESRRSP
jgi:hypothetical protein